MKKFLLFLPFAILSLILVYKIEAVDISTNTTAFPNYQQGYLDTVYGYPYQIIEATATTSSSTTFTGHATNIFLAASGGQVDYWGTFSVKDSTGKLFSGDAINMNFFKPVSSPTIVVYTIAAGATLQIHIGGLKKNE